MAHCQDRHMYTKTTKTKGPTAQCQFDTSLCLYISTVKNVKQTTGTVFRSENFKSGKKDFPFLVTGWKVVLHATISFSLKLFVYMQLTLYIIMGGFYITSGAPCVGCTWLACKTHVYNIAQGCRSSPSFDKWKKKSCGLSMFELHSQW